MRLRFGSLVSLMICAATATSAGQIGTLDGVLGDSPRAWQVHAVPGAGSTGTDSKLFPGQTSFRIQDHVDGQMTLEGGLSVSFDLADGGAVLDSNIIYLPTSDIATCYEAIPGDLTLTVLEQTEGDGHIRIVGHVSGVLVVTTRTGAAFQADSEDELTVDVRFATQVVREDWGRPTPSPPAAPRRQW